MGAWGRLLDDHFSGPLMETAPQRRTSVPLLAWDSAHAGTPQKDIQVHPTLPNPAQLRTKLPRDLTFSIMEQKESSRNKAQQIHVLQSLQLYSCCQF